MFLGTRYEITGLPLSCGREAIETLLTKWTGAVPITTYRSGRTRTWLVSAPSAPLIDKLQHGDGLAHIQAAVPRAQHKKAQGIKFVPSEKPTEEPSWLRTWAGKPRSKQAGETCSSPPPPPTQKPAAPRSANEVRLPTASSSTQDLSSMIQEAVAKAMSSFASAMTSLECKVASLTSDVADVQTQAARRDMSTDQRKGDRTNARGQSRSRGRVPVGKKLYG